MQSYKNASEETLDSIGIEKFVNAFGNRELRRSVLQHNCKTLDEALNVAIRMEAIDMTSGPTETSQMYDADGIRRDRANVRIVSADDQYFVSNPDLSPARSDLTFWKSQTPSVAYRQPQAPSVMGDGLCFISGLSNSASYQQPMQTPRAHPQQLQYAPTQSPQLHAPY